MGNSSASLKTRPLVVNKAFQANFDRLVSAIKPAIGEFARKAFQCNLITQQNLSDAENLMLPLDNRASTLLRQIYDRIKANQDHFLTFVAILQEIPILAELAHELVSALHDCSTGATASFKKSRGKKKKVPGVKFSDVSQCDRSLSSSCEFHSTANLPGTVLSNYQHTDVDKSYTPSESSQFEVSEYSQFEVTRSDIHTKLSKTAKPTIRQVSLNSTGGSLPSSYGGASLLSSIGGYQPSISDSESSQADSIPPFQCGCGGHCSLNSFVKGKCPQESFPYLKLDRLSRMEREKLVRKLTSDAQEMIDIFAQLVCDTFDSLESREIPVERLRANTLTFGQQKLPKPYSDEHIDKLSLAKTVRDIQLFLVGYKYISFFNYGILQKIVNHFGTEKDKQKLSDYLIQFSTFCTRSVFEVPASIIHQLAPDSEIEQSLVVKVSEHLWFSTKSYFTMEDLYAVEKSIAKIIGVDSSFILLRDIKEGCVELTLSVLSETRVLPLAVSQLVELVEIGINVVVDDQISQRLHPSIQYPSCSYIDNTMPEGSCGGACLDSRVHHSTSSNKTTASSPTLSTNLKLPIPHHNTKQPIATLGPLLERSTETLDSYTQLDDHCRPSQVAPPLTVIGNDGTLEPKQEQQVSKKMYSNSSSKNRESLLSNNNRRLSGNPEMSLGYCSMESSIGSYRRESASENIFSSIFSSEGSNISVTNSGRNTPVPGTRTLSPTVKSNSGRQFVAGSRRHSNDPQFFKLPPTPTFEATYNGCSSFYCKNELNSYY